ncbi:MAG: hypothetical protein ACRDHE_07450 [Ktedonobacterales bacterium]
MARSDDSSKVQTLYAAILAAPPPVHIDWCPADIGADYQLTFTSGPTIVLQIQMLEGCRKLVLSDSAGCRVWDGKFVAQLADTLGIPVSALLTGGSLINTAGPNGPFAPQVPTPPLLTPTHC